MITVVVVVVLFCFVLFPFRLIRVQVMSIRELQIRSKSCEIVNVVTVSDQVLCDFNDWFLAPPFFFSFPF